VTGILSIPEITAVIDNLGWNLIIINYFSILVEFLMNDDNISSYVMNM